MPVALGRGLPKVFARGLLAGLSFLALAASGAPLLDASAVAQTQIGAPAPPKPDPDGEYGENLEPFEADGPLMAVVSTGSQSIRIFDRNGLIATSKVSTGRKGYDTPEGVFSIIERKVEHNSNLYDDASMPFMQRLTWSGVALHEGVVPGYRASHGCIRLPSGFAERLFRTTGIGSRVMVVSHDGVPQPISHPVLFQPGMTVAPPQSAPSNEIRPTPSGDGADERPMMLGGKLPPKPVPGVLDATSAETGAGTPAASATALTTAMLKERRVTADRKLAAATKAVDAEKSKVRPRLVEQGKAEKALRQATALANRTDGRVAVLDKAVQSARNDAARTNAVNAHIDGLLELARARGREDQAREFSAQATAASLAIQDHVKKLEAERQAAHNEARVIARRLSPVTVFVSRQTGRIYVRQATHQIMEVAAEIRDAEKPIGTHVFTALETAADKLKWMALTIDPVASAVAHAPTPQPKRKKGEAISAPTPKIDSIQSASSALDRITLPEAVLARISPALQPGSTLIVSDFGPSIETGPGTDVVVQTRGEEQAIQNIANFVAKKKAEAAAQAVSYAPPRRRDNGWSRSGDWGRW